jgi:amino acid transporter
MRLAPQAEEKHCTMTTFAIYCYLLAVTTLYAALLASFKHLWEPDLTWLEVVIGVAICLLAPYFDNQLNGPLTSEGYEQRVWMAFVIGGLPIVVWRVGASIRAWGRIGRHTFLRKYDNTTDRATSVAGERRGQPEEGDRPR